MIRVRSPQDLGAGLLFAAFGAAGLIFGTDYDRGTAAKMGPGYFPFLLSAGLILLGLCLGARGLTIKGPAIERVVLRPYLFTVAAILAFGFLIEPLGLVPTTIVMTLIAAAASRGVKWVEAAILGVALAAISLVLFVYVLGQSLTAFGG